MTDALAAPYTDTEWDADVIKTGTWDLWIPTGDGREPPVKLIDALDELLDHLGVLPSPKRAQVAALSRFLSLPAARVMPDTLRRQIRAYVE